ncbi:hypothetical protein BDU57DRAFT_304041 [Ampelomyces quisqualis]|uniref:Uncharacterized protein n=1 Tax=Ampelomyces quisqualis TaxID=50730 RepID=A0A6A5QL13_AMPQU|nr:hypothetical protein BDU57DRAFT_304041 [Ampelomyces quisqualis]
MPTAFSFHGTKRKVADTNKKIDSQNEAPQKRAKIAFDGIPDSAEHDQAHAEVEEEVIVPSTAPTKKNDHIEPAQNKVKLSTSVTNRASRDAQATSKTTNRPTKPSHERARAEQNIFLIHCRDNIVPGATGPKTWKDVTAEFNEKFTNVLKRPLSYKTIQKRSAEARENYLQDNPDYPATVSYPCYVSASGDGKECDHMEVDTTAPQVGKQIQNSEDEAIWSRNQHAPMNTIPATDVHWVKNHPGAALDPASVPLKNVYPMDQAKYHLRRRATDTAIFYFLDPYEAEMVEFDPHTVDHKTMLDISPRYRRLEFYDPERPIDVPKKFGSRTVNAFCQMVAPVRAKSLPTHSLWRNGKRTDKQPGPIVPEKIYWSVDTLLELIAFAHYMEVYWISDMVIDRLHWMFLEKKKLEESHATIMQNFLKELNQNKENKHAAPKLPKLPELNCPNLTLEDLDTDWLDDLVQDNADLKTLSFLADLQIALGGASNQQWTDRQELEVSQIFTIAEMTGDSCLLDVTRTEFCGKYHHHDEDAEDAVCYTHYFDPYPHALVSLLREAEAREERLDRPMLPENLMSKASGATQTNGTFGMLHVEKMAKILEMQKRLDQAKTALLEARKNGKDGKEGRVKSAREVAEEVLGALETLRSEA